MKALALRLNPGADLRQSLQDWAIAQSIQAGCILTAVGSLQVATLRLAGQSESQIYAGPFEIVSLVGTLSLQGLHLHLAIADAQGHLLGGHLQRGCLIYTTAEIVVGELEDMVFTRAVDPQTGFLELEIQSRRAVPEG